MSSAGVSDRSVPPVSAAGSFGVYVHIPFCATRCDYCAFATWTDKHDLIDRYLAAVCGELRTRRDVQPVPTATSVFFGGGTPSLVAADSLMLVLDQIERVDGAEVTVECNPDTVTEVLLRTYRQHGVNRISLGVQSMVPHVLRSLGRSHDLDNVLRAAELINKVGFDSFNLDLIYGSAGETMDDWRATLEAALALGAPHVSAYALTVEPGTPLAADVARHPDDDAQAAYYEVADDLLDGAGLANYEISNWARRGHECRHNILYWRQGDYLGVGCAAHGHRGGRRSWNVRTIDRYVAMIESGEGAEAGCEILDAEARRLEGLQLALRMREGVPSGALPVRDLAGLVEVHGERVVLTRSGRLVANDLSVRLR